MTATMMDSKMAVYWADEMGALMVVLTVDALAKLMAAWMDLTMELTTVDLTEMS